MSKNHLVIGIGRKGLSEQEMHEMKQRVMSLVPNISGVTIICDCTNLVLVPGEEGEGESS